MKKVILVLILLLFTIATFGQPRTRPLPYYDISPHSMKVESVYGDKYNTHYNHFKNQWTLESKSNHTFTVILEDSNKEIIYFSNVSSLEVFYGNDDSIPAVVITTIIWDEMNNKPFIVETISKSFLKINSINVTNLK
jgi:hypothetical protein